MSFRRFLFNRMILNLTFDINLLKSLLSKGEYEKFMLEILKIFNEQRSLRDKTFASVLKESIKREWGYHYLVNSVLCDIIKKSIKSDRYNDNNKREEIIFENEGKVIIFELAIYPTSKTALEKLNNIRPKLYGIYVLETDKDVEIVVYLFDSQKLRL